MKFYLQFGGKYTEKISHPAARTTEKKRTFATCFTGVLN